MRTKLSLLSVSFFPPLLLPSLGALERVAALAPAWMIFCLDDVNVTDKPVLVTSETGCKLGRYTKIN